MICRKATIALLDANPCLFEHKIGIFVLGKYVLGVARVVLLGVWLGLFVCSKECEELFSEGGGVFEEQCVHAGGDGTLYVGWLVVCEEAL